MRRVAGDQRGGEAVSDAREQVIGEKGQIDDRIDKLHRVLSDDAFFDKLNRQEVALLRLQLCIMEAYSRVLNERLLVWRDDITVGVKP